MSEEMCAGNTRNGDPCRRRAVAPSRYCAVHRRAKGDPFANLFSSEELTQLDELGSDDGLEVEIGAARLALQQALRAGDVAGVSGCVNAIIAAARLRRQLSGEQARTLLQAVDTILAELSYAG